MAVGFAALLALSLLFSASAALPRSYFELTVVYDEQDFPQLRFTFQLTNPVYVPDQNMEAANVSVTVTVGPELIVDGVGGGTWSAFAEDVSSSVSFRMFANVTPSAQDTMSSNPGTTIFTSVFVTVQYTDDQGNGVRTIQRTLTFPLDYHPPASSLYLAGAVGMGLGGAGVAALGFFLVRRARLNELYLMHDSGMLIRHWSKSGGLIHDSDIMSGMLIVLQEFVRDTWKSYDNGDASLEELRFGPERVLLARGKHSVLAAVVQGRYLNGLPKKLQQAVTEFERSHEAVLRNWNGNLDLLPGTDDVAHRFLKGRPRPA
ncbi:MAG TPA: hypothetical protein VI999_02025 [Thermoplasmata archaeon]|nr:hypothetical protein [Thermoplasmata archaeon]